MIRRPYQKPRLRELGDLTDLTQTAVNANEASDGGGSPGQYAT